MAIVVASVVSTARIVRLSGQGLELEDVVWFMLVDEESGFQPPRRSDRLGAFLHGGRGHQSDDRLGPFGNSGWRNSASSLAFLHSEWPLLTFLGLLIFPGTPVASFLTNTLTSHTLSVGMPAAIQWQGRKAVERQDLAFFHDLFAGQVVSRLSQVASAVQQQIIAAFQAIPALRRW